MSRRINGFMVAIALGLSTLAPSSAFGQAEGAAAPAATTLEATAPAADAAPAAAAPAAPAFEHDSILSFPMLAQKTGRGGVPA